MMRRPTADGAGKPVFTFSDAKMHADAPGRGVDDDARPPPPPARMAHRAVASDVTLQMLLSNHVLFSAAWWVATVLSTFVKTNGAYQDFDDIRPMMLAIWTVFEPCRLYMGYAGNLQEKVPLLWGFVALSLVVSLPLAAYFWFGQEQVQPFDQALNTVTSALLVAECFAGVNGARKVLREQNLAFFEGER